MMQETFIFILIVPLCGSGIAKIIPEPPVL
jgi:hypothetical protein